MKRYWPIFFLIALMLFQGYVSLLNKDQIMTLANHEKKLTSTPSKTLPLPTDSCTSVFFYPNAKINEPDTKSFFMQTEDDPSQVTDWYKQTLQQEGFSLSTDVVNTTNGTTSNMLVGEKDNQHISIVVNRDAQEAMTTIFVHSLCQ